MESGSGVRITSTLRCGFEGKIDKLKLVDFIGELEDEDLVEL